MKMDEKQGFLKFIPDESVKKESELKVEEKLPDVSDAKEPEPTRGIMVDENSSCQYCSGGMCSYCDQGRALTKERMKANEGKTKKSGSFYAKRRWKFKSK